MTTLTLVLCTCLAVTSACRTNRLKGEGMQTTSPVITPSGSEPHRFEYVIESGRELGSGIHETETRLRVDYDKNEAFLERHQPLSDEGGEALGTFRTELPADARDELLKGCAAVHLSSLPVGKSGGPGVSQIRLVEVSGARISKAEFSARDVPIIERADPILSVGNSLIGALGEHPFQAIRIKVRRLAEHSGGDTFEIDIENAGTQNVVVPDPHRLAALGTGEGSQGLGVRIAEYPAERPGYTAPPLVWSWLPVAPSKTDAPLVSLAPGGRVAAVTVPWVSRKHAMRHLVQAVYAFYGEPVMLDGHLVIRGRALSEALEVTP